MIKLKKEKKKGFVCDGCGKVFENATRTRFYIRLAGYERYNMEFCNSCIRSLKKKLTEGDDEQ